MRRRLLQRLQHGVEGVVGELMHLVDHVHLVAAAARGIGGTLEQIDHVIHAAIGRGIHLDVIDKATRINRHTGVAHATRVRGDVSTTVSALTIECFGENAR